MRLGAFWSFWPYRELEWTLFRFMNALAVPALLYAFISLLVPQDPTVVTSWRDYFFDVRARLFATGAIFTTTVTISNQATLDVPVFHPSQLANYASVAAFLGGFASAKQRVHVILALVFGAGFAAYLFALMIEPDSIFRAVP